MQEQEEELVDYNDPMTPPPSHSPVQTPLNLNSDSDGEEEDKRQEEAAKRALEEGRKAKGR